MFDGIKLFRVCINVYVRSVRDGQAVPARRHDKRHPVFAWRSHHAIRLLEAAERPPDDCDHRATWQSLDAFNLIEFGAPALEHHVKVSLMGSLDVRLSAPVHSHDIDPMNVIGRQLPHCIHIGRVPRCLPAAYNCAHLPAYVVVDCSIALGLSLDTVRAMLAVMIPNLRRVMLIAATPFPLWSTLSEGLRRCL